MANLSRGKQLGILFGILVFPSLLYVLSATGKHNFVRLPFYGEKLLHPKDKLKSGAPDTIYYNIPDFEFSTFSGERVSSEAYTGKIKVFSFVCVSCDYKGARISEQLAAIQESVVEGKDVNIIQLSLNPNGDSEEQIAAFRKGFKANSEVWKTVKTESLSEVYNFALNGLLLSTNENVTYNDSILNTSTIVLVDHHNHIRGYFDGTQYVDTKELKDAIQQLRYLKNVIEPGMEAKRERDGISN